LTFFPIKSKSIIKKIFDVGINIKGASFTIKYIHKDKQKIGIGIIVPKKIIPLAAKRNLIRRRIKFFLQDHYEVINAKLPNGLYLIMYSDPKILNYKEIKKSILYLLDSSFHNT